MSVRWISDDSRLVVRDEDDHVKVGIGLLHDYQLHPDEARRMAAGLCVAAERVDERDTERSHAA